MPFLQRAGKMAKPVWLFLFVFYFISNKTAAQNVGVGTTSPNATIEVIRGTAADGTAKFRGTTHASHFNYSTNEDTYIRAGKDNGNVIINDIPGGLVGIGTSAPGFPLNFPNTLGDKISLWGNSGAHYGFGIQGSLLQIHSANSSDDIAFGYGSSASFTERMRIKGNGALSVNGNTGAFGQVLQSNGNASSPTWVNNPAAEIYSFTNETPATGELVLSPLATDNIPGLARQITLTSQSRVIVQFMILVRSLGCGICGGTSFDLWINLNGANTGRIRKSIAASDYYVVTGTRIFTLASGVHNFTITASHLTGPSIRLAENPPTNYPSFLFIQVIPSN